MPTPTPSLVDDGPHGQTLRLLPGNPYDHLGIRSGRTEPHALGPGIGKPSLDAVPDHRSLELCEDAHHLEEGAVEVDVDACAVGLS